MQQNLYTFINSRARAHKMKVDNLAEACGFSRSTMYRYMNGVLEISPELERRLGQILQLDETERQEFNRLIHLVGEPTVTLARETLDSFFFQPPSEAAEGRAAPGGDPQSLVCYQNDDRYLRDLEEIGQSILANAGKPDFHCHVHLYNCLDAETWRQLSPVLTQLISQGGATVTHLLQLDKEDSYRSIQSLLCIIPLLRHPSYQVYYREGPECPPDVLVPSQSLFIRATYSRGDRQKQLSYFVNFREKGLSPCLAVRDENAYRFFEQCFSDARELFPHPLAQSNGVSFIDELLSAQQQHECYLLKSNFCYDNVPPAIYRNMLNRMMAAAQSGEVSGLADIEQLFPISENGDSWATAEALVENLTQRNATSYKQRYVGVHSCQGLMELARTGCLSDHLSFFPSFSDEELVEIFTQARDRNADPQDSYTLHLVDAPMFAGGCCVLVFKDHHLVLQYENSQPHGQINFHYLTVHSEKLAEVFGDYVDRHVAHSRALSLQESTEFLDGLIRDIKARN